MRKRGFLLIFVFLILVKSSFSLTQENVFSGTVFHRDIIEIEGVEFDFKVIKGYIAVDIGVSGLIIQNGDCDIKNNFNVCVKNVTFAYRNSTTWEEIYKALVDVYIIKSSLTVTEIMEKSNILIGEKIDVTLSLENTADIPAVNIVFSDQFPNEIQASDPVGCTLSFNKITFKGQVNPNQIKTCTYKLKGLEPISYDSGYVGSYFDGVNTVNLTSDKSITVLNYSLSTNISLDKEIISIGEVVGLGITLKNINEDDDLTMTSFLLEIPKGFIIIDKPKEMLQKGNIFIWSGKINKETDVNFTASLKASKSGKQVINLNAAYQIGGFLRNLNRSFDYNVKCDCPIIDHKIGTIVPGLKTDFKVSLINPGSIDFRNLKVDYSSNIPGIGTFSTAYGRFFKGSNINLIDTRILSPSEDEKYFFNISIVYQTTFNEFFTETKTIIISEEKIEVKEEVIEVKEENNTEETSEEKIDVESEEIEEKIETTDSSENSTQPAENDPIIIDQDIDPSFKSLYIVAGMVFIILSIGILWIVKGRKEEEIELPPEF